jgi:TrmH family RNA methyltransferase
MINKSTVKLIKSLALKKFRLKENRFLTEGDKNVLEVLNSGYRVDLLIATDSFLAAHKNAAEKAGKVIPATPQEIKQASLLKTPQNSLAVCELPAQNFLPQSLESISLFLDGIQDPGNLGTIIRTCDWFGIDQIFCSPNTVDLYNPKVIQATMGSFSRVRVFYTEIEKLNKLTVNSEITIFGTFLEGSNIYTEQLPQKALIVIGNEGKGISKTVEKYIDKKIRIPYFGDFGNRAESLNAAIATAVICSEFKRLS